MKWIFRCLSCFILLTVASSSFSQVYVKGYYRGDGTYVQPHYRSKPDGNPYNNWSYPGNVNPYTGKVATGDPNAYLNRYYSRTISSAGSYYYLIPSTSGDVKVEEEPSYPRFSNILQLNGQSYPSRETIKGQSFSRIYNYLPNLKNAEIYNDELNDTTQLLGCERFIATETSGLFKSTVYFTFDKNLNLDSYLILEPTTEFGAWVQMLAKQGYKMAYNSANEVYEFTRNLPKSSLIIISEDNDHICISYIY